MSRDGPSAINNYSIRPSFLIQLRIMQRVIVCKRPKNLVFHLLSHPKPVDIENIFAAMEREETKKQ